MKILGAALKLTCHFRTTYQLQLMHFKSGQWQTGQFGRLSDNFVMGLSRKTEDDVSSGQNPASSRPVDSFYRIGIGMPTVDTFQSNIPGGFNTIFYQKESVLIQFFQISQQGIRHAVRTCADDQSHHPVHTQSLFIFPFQSFKLGIGIGISLKISQIFHIRIFMGKELLSFLKLPGDGFLRFTILGIECLVITVRTASQSLRSVSVRTCKTRIKRYLLYLIGKVFFQKESKFVI